MIDELHLFDVGEAAPECTKVPTEWFFADPGTAEAAVADTCCTRCVYRSVCHRGCVVCGALLGVLEDDTDTCSAACHSALAASEEAAAELRREKRRDIKRRQRARRRAAFATSGGAAVYGDAADERETT